ncbi:hypothetical protein N7G274_004866 [Stereocaulon virgatum]|uniref:NACHT-NTPase and P-loop NTPases N-terminal domain-containing protein n=1 Tax=Stereocaulon virgatum TaxID=373712 RepID=A0ABR4ABX6_9LECA
MNEMPKAFLDIKNELPLLFDKLKRTKEQVDLGTISQETQDALLPVINGCRSQAEQLGDMLIKRFQKQMILLGSESERKTQIAIEYRSQYHEQCPDAHVLWVHASTVPRLDQAYKSIARKLNIPGWDNLDLNTFEIVSNWLSEHGKWLLVLDNADELDNFFAAPTCFGSPQVVPTKQMHELIPRSEDGTIPITTRDKRIDYRLADREEPILVSLMTIEEAKALLRCNTSAAAFMFEDPFSVSEYLEIFRTNESEIEEIISEDLGDHRRYSDTPSLILNTLTLTLDQVVKQKPLAANLLSSMAYLDRQTMSRSLLKRENVRSVDFVLALGILQAFSRINLEKGGASFGVHRLVELSTQRWLKGSRLK